MYFDFCYKFFFRWEQKILCLIFNHEIHLKVASFRTTYNSKRATAKAEYYFRSICSLWSSSVLLYVSVSSFHNENSSNYIKQVCVLIMPSCYLPIFCETKKRISITSFFKRILHTDLLVREGEKKQMTDEIRGNVWFRV